MKHRKAMVWTLVLVVMFFLSERAQAQLGATVSNWTPPAYSPATAVQGGMHVMSDVTHPIAFVGIAPCRVVDTRQAAGPFGGPHISPGSPRSFAIPSGPCSGIPSSFGSQAYSLNITATNTTATGFVKVFPEGGSSPVVSTLNFVAGVTIANAAVVAAGTSGGVTVAASATTDILIDINGYYSDTPNNQGNDFVLNNNSGGFTMNLTNNSTICTGVCGLAVTAKHGFAIGGEAEGASDQNYGVWGRSDSSAAGSAGVYGLGESTGATYGVSGQSNGTASDAAGVFGVDSSGPTARTGVITAGVRGESASFLGVYGGSQYLGVAGAVVDTAGVSLAEGYLGLSGPYGVFSEGDFGGTGAKYFVEPHPTDASKVIRYVSLEGPQSQTFFNGTAQVSGGQAVITVPDDFRIVTDSGNLVVQLTPIGAPASLYVVSEDLNQIVVGSDKDIRVHYTVNGIRKAFKDHQAISDGQEFMPQSPTAKMPAYLTDEAKSRLIANGTYNADGTVNMATAQRLGWLQIWADRAAAAQNAAARNAAAPRSHANDGK